MIYFLCCYWWLMFWSVSLFHCLGQYGINFVFLTNCSTWNKFSPNHTPFYSRNNETQDEKDPVSASCIISNDFILFFVYPQVEIYLDRIFMSRYKCLLQLGASLVNIPPSKHRLNLLWPYLLIVFLSMTYAIYLLFFFLINTFIVT